MGMDLLGVISAGTGAPQFGPAGPEPWRALIYCDKTRHTAATSSLGRKGFSKTSQGRSGVLHSPPVVTMTRRDGSLVQACSMKGTLLSVSKWRSATKT